MRAAKQVGPERDDLISVEVSLPKRATPYEGQTESDERIARDYIWYYLLTLGWTVGRIQRACRRADRSRSTIYRRLHQIAAHIEATSRPQG
jgi:transcriptional regulator of acetoin/glycerol metabolism